MGTEPLTLTSECRKDKKLLIFLALYWMPFMSCYINQTNRKKYAGPEGTRITDLKI